MKVKVIKDQTEYEAALKLLSQLMDKKIIPGSDEENVIELLLVVLKDYEQKNLQPIDVDPVEAIKFRMDQLHLAKKDLVPFLGAISKVSEVLSGKRKLSLSMIRKLHEGLGIPFESLLRKR
jgi:HTH-type transcriptional regulator/antitoxin HigA